MYPKSDPNPDIINKQRTAAKFLLTLYLYIVVLQIKLFNGLIVIDRTKEIKKYIINS